MLLFLVRNQKLIAETDTDVILGWESSELVTAIILYMWRPAGRKTCVGILIKGQLIIVHVHGEVSVLGDVALHSLSKSEGSQ